MNEFQKVRINSLRQKGLGYMKVAKELDLSVNTVKSYCRRNNISKSNCNCSFCKNCGKELIQKRGKKERRFCDDHCRSQYWSKNQGEINRKTAIEHICPICNKRFVDYARNNRKYCSRACYIKARYGGDDNE